MNIFRTLPIVLACMISLPLSAQASKDVKTYRPPESVEKTLALQSSTKNTVTFRFNVKSLIGNAKNVKLKARLLGNSEIVPVPNLSELEVISEGKNASLDFVIPITEEQAQDRSLKIESDIEYLPDYEAIIKYVEDDPDKLYPIPVEKEILIDSLKKNKSQAIKSIQTIRYIPVEKK